MQAQRVVRVTEVVGETQEVHTALHQGEALRGRAATMHQGGRCSRTVALRRSMEAVSMVVLP